MRLHSAFSSDAAAVLQSFVSAGTLPYGLGGDVLGTVIGAFTGSTCIAFELLREPHMLTAGSFQFCAVAAQESC